MDIYGWREGDIRGEWKDIERVIGIMGRRMDRCTEDIFIEWIDRWLVG